jgi:hypothetical protein
LNFSKNQTELFCLLIDAEHSRNKTLRSIARSKAAILSQTMETPLSLDAFQVISDWHHFAILELGSLKGFRITAANVAKDLGLHLEVATAAIERLIRLELLVLRRGALKPSEDFTFTNAGIPSEAVKTKPHFMH